MADECKYLIRRANLHDVRKQITDALCDVDSRVITLEQSISGGIRFDYKYTTSLSGDPTAGYVGGDTLDPATTTELRISGTTASGNEATPFISELKPNDLIAIYEAVAPHGTAIFNVDAIPTDSGGYFTVAVSEYPTGVQEYPALQDNPVDLHLLERREHDLYDQHVHSDVDSSLPLEQRHLLAWNNVGKFSADFRMNWRGNWTAIEYQKHDVVFDTPYTMIANKVTTDRAAPQDVGSPAWDLPDQPLWVDFSNTSVVGSGHSYVFSETVYVNSVRVWIPTVTADYTYRLTIVRTNSVVQYDLPTVSGDQWNVIGVNATLIFAGETFVVYLEALNSGGTTVVTGGWIRGINDNAAEPADTNWNMNTQRTLVRISFNDLDAPPTRQTELEGIVVGSTIQFAETLATQNSITFQVLNPPVTGTTSVQYDVVVISEGVALPTVGQASTMTADIPVPQATDFVGIVDGWIGNEPIYADVTSYLTFDGVDQGADPDNQYGVSINVQRIDISEDWDVVAISGGGGGGGGDNSTELAGYLGEAFPTGLYDGGELNIVGGGLNIEIIAGAGVIVDSYTDPLDIPSRVNISWATQNEPITSPAVAGQIAWYTMANAGTQGVLDNSNLGLLIERSVRPTPAQERDEIFIGIALYNGDEWKEISSPTVVNSTAHSFNEYIKSIGQLTHMDSGGDIHEAALFTLDQDEGVIWELNRNWHVNRKDPSRESFVARPNFQWRYTNRDFSTVSALTGTVDPANYDDAGTVVPVGGGANTCTIQRLYLDPADNFWVLYGQTTHDNFFEALADIGHDNTITEVPFILDKALFLGYIVTERVQSDWQLEHAEFVSYIQFSSGGGGAPVTTYDDLTDTPSNKLGSALMYPRVNAGETAHEYQLIDYSEIQNPPVGGTLWGGSLGADIWNLNSGNVGIGNAAPAAKLAVNVADTDQVGKFAANNHNAALYISSPDSTRFDLNAGWNTDPSGAKFLTFSVGQSERMRIDSAGNVGIGTIVPESKLHVSRDTLGHAPLTGAGTLAIFEGQLATNAYIQVIGDDTKKNGIRFGTPTQTTLSQIAWDDANANLSIGASVDGIAGSTDVINLKGGNVGIGTADPLYKLEIKDSNTNIYAPTIAMRSTGDAGEWCRMDFINTAIGKTGLVYMASGGEFVFRTDTGKVALNAQGAYPVEFLTNGIRRMVVTADGNVGINTETPESFLTVLSDTSNAHFRSQQNFPDKSDDFSVRIDTYGSSPNFGNFGSGTKGGLNVQAGWSTLSVPIAQFSGLTTGFAEVPVMTIMSSGNVGIGTTTPKSFAKLHLESGGTSGSPFSSGLLILEAGTGNVNLQFAGSITSKNNIVFGDTETTNIGRIRYDHAIDAMEFRVNTLTSMQLNSDGGMTLPATTVTGGSQGSGSINVSGNYYINGVPISSFVDAPADGNLYARKDNAWSSIGVGAGTVSDLSYSRDASIVNILNTGGDDTVIPAATVSLAGVQTAVDKQKLDNIEPNANYYIHPSGVGAGLSIDTGTLAGANVVSRVQVEMSSNSDGHVTSASAVETVRTMIANDLNAYTKPEVDALIPPITAGVASVGFNLGGSTSGTVVWHRIGNLVILSGRLSWSTAPSGGGNLYIIGLPFYNDYATGIGMSCNSLSNNVNAGNGMMMTIEAGTDQISLWGYNENGVRSAKVGNNASSNGSIDINISYYTSDA